MIEEQSNGLNHGNADHNIIHKGYKYTYANPLTSRSGDLRFYSEEKGEVEIGLSVGILRP